MKRFLFLHGWGIIIFAISAAITATIVTKPGVLALSTPSLADRIVTALGNDPHVVLEIRANGDGTFTPVLSPEDVRRVVVRELERK